MEMQSRFTAHERSAGSRLQKALKRALGNTRSQTES
jgi:hypothetical protein